MCAPHDCGPAMSSSVHSVTSTETLNLTVLLLVTLEHTPSTILAGLRTEETVSHNKSSQHIFLSLPPSLPPSPLYTYEGQSVIVTVMETPGTLTGENTTLVDISCRERERGKEGGRDREKEGESDRERW